MMPIMDAYTNVFFSPGTRTLGEEGKSFFISGPGYKGEVPEGMENVTSPTN